MAAQQKITRAVPAVTIAATTTTIVGEADAAGRVTGVSYTPAANITGAASPDSRTFTLVNKGQSGSGTTVIATLAMTSGVNATAYDEKALTLSSTAADRVVAAEDVLAWVSTAVTGAGGLVDPGGSVEVTVGSSRYTTTENADGTTTHTEA